MKILVTGSRGFLGKNLIAMLQERGHAVEGFDVGASEGALEAGIASADFIFHLAGANRPENPEDFERVNVDLTASVIAAAKARRVPIAFSSSSQAELDNPYGLSKRKAEDLLLDHARTTGARVYIFRFPNLFGKWCRPDYNSAVATFCHRIAHGQDYWISDRAKLISLCFVEDAVMAMLELLSEPADTAPAPWREATPVFVKTLGEIADLLESFKTGRERMEVPQVGDPFVFRLYSTYLSYLEPGDLAVLPVLRRDDRGWLFELTKSKAFGQVFVSTTRPGVTRGNHYHHTKVEKFCVIRGRAEIRIRGIFGERVERITVDSDEIRIVDIPPGFTHSITNIGNEDMIVLFWANETFDPEDPDTHFMKVVDEP